MNQALLLVILLAAVIAGGLIAKRISQPYPIVFVIGGVALPFVPNLPHWQLNPSLIFLIVLPPLLFSGAWTTDWYAFKRNIRSISLLAVGLVVFTAAIVAWLAHDVVGLSWPLAFALGAIVAPPDPVAAEAIFERFSVPSRIVTILTGEGLVNDGTALVIYRLAVTAAVAGAFTLQHLAISFVIVATGGIAIGTICGIAIASALHFLRVRKLNDSTLVTVLVLLAPYAAYLPAEALNVSGVLAAVSAGIYLSRNSGTILDSESRIVGSSVWNVMTYLLNAFVFLAIGLQLRPIVASIRSSPGTFVQDAALVTLAIIALRMVWVFPASYLPRILSRRIRERDPAPSWRAVTLVGYAGMRGIVSLAAALALPYAAADGTPLAGRAEIIVITLAVIFVTLVGQGLTLGPLIRLLGLSETSNAQRTSTKVRIRALRAGVARLREMESTFTTALQWETAGRLTREYEQRIEHLQGHLNEEKPQDQSIESSVDHQLQHAALVAERHEISLLREVGDIPDDVYREIEYDLDLADLRLS